jgi:hypothetical protein
LEQRKNSLIELFFGIAVAAIVITLHFYLCIQVIHAMGDPLHVPDSLKEFNRLLRWGPENFLSFIFLVLWLLFYLCFYFVLVFIAKTLIRIALGLISKDKGMSALTAKKAFSRLIPFSILSLVTLSIIPVQSSKGTSHDSVMSSGAWMEFPEFLVLATDMSLMMLVALSLVCFPFIFMALVDLVKPKKYEPGMGMFFLSIFLGIAFAVTLGMFSFPLFEHVHSRMSPAPALFCIFGCYASISAIGLSLHHLKKDKRSSITHS